MRRRPRVEEIFVLNGILALAWAALWLAWRRELLLELGDRVGLEGLDGLGHVGELVAPGPGNLHRQIAREMEGELHGSVTWKEPGVSDMTWQLTGRR